MPVPAFGFSAGDFISTLGLINTVRKALKNSGGSQDELQAVLQDLHQLETILTLLHEGDWGKGSDLSHVNAVRGLALTCKEPLRQFLEKLTMAHDTMSNARDNLKGLFQSNAKKGQWAIFLREDVDHFRQVILAKLIAINTLLSMPLRWAQDIHGWISLTS